MKIKKIHNNDVEIKINYGPSFDYELPNSYEQFKDDLLKQGYSLSKGELYYINSNSEKIIIKSKNDYISLMKNVQESPSIIQLFYQKEIIDSFISDIDFINIKNVYSDLITDDSILEASVNDYNNKLNTIYENDDKDYFNQGINIILNIYKKKYFHNIINYLDFQKNKLEYNILKKIPKNNLTSSIQLEYTIPSVENLMKKSNTFFPNNNDKILDNLWNNYEQLEGNRNNNYIYETMLINKINQISNLKSKDSIININNSKIYNSEIINNNFFYECNNCHKKPIKNIRYKCSKCFNYNLCEICEEKNFQFLFHPHAEFILIRINEKNLDENPYSYQCLSKNLSYNIKKEEIIDDKIIIKNILIKNNFILPWPGKKNTLIKCDKSLSSIFCENIYLPNLALGNTVNIDFIFLKANKVPKGKYICICDFIVNNDKYGEPLELYINIF